MSDLIHDVMKEILSFREERDWAQFHSVKNLSAALSIEAAEVQEVILWDSESAFPQRLLTNPALKQRLSEEVADVLIYALLLCNTIDADPIQAIRDKLALNARKYPVALSKGTATKYNRFPKNLDGESSNG